MSELFDLGFMEGEKSIDPEKGKYYNPPHAENLKKVKEIATKEREIAEECKKMPHRVQTVAMRLLLRHAEYCEKIAEILIVKAGGDQETAKEMLAQFGIDFGRYEVEMERYYDHFMVIKTMNYFMSEKIALF